MPDDLYAPIDFDIAPEIPDPVVPLWADLGRLRRALGQPAGTLWRYTVGEMQVVVNDSALTTHIADPRPFEMEGQMALLFMGRGVLGYVTPRRLRFLDARGPVMLRAIIDETLAERPLPKPDPWAGKPRCENCGVILGEFAGDTKELCEQCLTHGPRRWLNRDPAQKRRGEV